MLQRNSAQSLPRKEEVLKGMFAIRSARGTEKPSKLGSVCPGWRGGMERQQQQAVSHISLQVLSSFHQGNLHLFYFFFLGLH